jgi:hypothetical protein
MPSTDACQALFPRQPLQGEVPINAIVMSTGLIFKFVRFPVDKYFIIEI